MGVTISCKKTGRSIDMGGGGFNNLRNRIAKLAGDEFGEHYAELSSSSVILMASEKCKEYYKAYNAKTREMVDAGRVNEKIANFCYQTDCGGNIRYGACKEILKVIGDYDDDILYGYSGHANCAKFKDFKAILQECVDNKCDMIWS